MKLELLTNATMLDDAIRAQHHNSNVKANKANLSTNSKTDTTASFLDSAGTDKEEGDDDSSDQEDTEYRPASRGEGKEDTTTTTNSVF